MTIRFEKMDEPFEALSVPFGKVDMAGRPGLYRNFGKRLCDIVLVIASLPLSLPLIVILSLAVAASGGKPIYSSNRVGRGGRVFRMFKLRTMVADAETCLDDHLARDPAARAEWDRSQKLRVDPRVTRLGRLLRKSSLDELPQILNILAGDMSIVGPRPMLPCQREIYPGQAYFALRPGLTGLWQVSARNETSFEARSGYDHQYFQSLSLPMDIAIIFRTVGVVLRGTGY